uniref:Uncharacterized protein n=1 Tax=Anguilla anguilla TaxID=7936 RepID=A0A0E9R3B6_ANGAN
MLSDLNNTILQIQISSLVSVPSFCRTCSHRLGHNMPVHFRRNTVIEKSDFFLDFMRIFCYFRMCWMFLYIQRMY